MKMHTINIFISCYDSGLNLIRLEGQAVLLILHVQLISKLQSALLYIYRYIHVHMHLHSVTIDRKLWLNKNTFEFTVFLFSPLMTSSHIFADDAMNTDNSVYSLSQFNKVTQITLITDTYILIN